MLADAAVFVGQTTRRVSLSAFVTRWVTTRCGSTTSVRLPYRAWPAKDLVDIQVAVTDLSAAHAAAACAREAGFLHVEGDWYGEDGCGVCTIPKPSRSTPIPVAAVNINLRAVTAPVWRDALLFRDWLRQPRRRTRCVRRHEDDTRQRRQGCTLTVTARTRCRGSRSRSPMLKHGQPSCQWSPVQLTERRARVAIGQNSAGDAAAPDTAEESVRVPVVLDAT